MFTIDFNDSEVNAALDGLSAVLADLSDAMNQIGCYLRDQAEDRFKTAPDGSHWAPRSEATLNNYKLHNTRFGGILHKSGDLGGSLFHQYGADWTMVGPSSGERKYQAMMQFGGKKSAWPHLWGDIPARPYLGMSDEDNTGVLDIITEAFHEALGK